MMVNWGGKEMTNCHRRLYFDEAMWHRSLEARGQVMGSGTSAKSHLGTLIQMLSQLPATAIWDEWTDKKTSKKGIENPRNTTLLLRRL